MSIVLLTASGAGSADDAPLDEICGALGPMGSVDVVTTGERADLDQTLDQLDGRTLVVAGGDGSLHLVVQALWERDQLQATTVGLVPLGTGNDFARSAGVPLDPVAAARALTTARPRLLDLVVDERGGVVVNVVHSGLGAEAAARAKGLKDRLGPAAYPVGALVAGVREPGWDLEVTVDGTPLGERVVLMAGAGNGRTIGGGTPLFPTASLDDGLLDVVVVNATGPVARVAFAAALRKGEHLDRDDVHHARGREVTITGDAVRYNTDGELSDAVPSRRYRIHPARWTFLGP
ncbi:hypothetical protein BH18ACT4_BH18ACT4_09370 [soil metagenome]